MGCSFLATATVSAVAFSLRVIWRFNNHWWSIPMSLVPQTRGRRLGDILFQSTASLAVS
jgi:hypothetical protein